MNEENEKWSERETWTPRNRKRVGRKAHATKTNMRYLVSLMRAIHGGMESKEEL
jgi:hypothetical protein